MTLHAAMAGHSRSKNGVAALAYVPAIHVFNSASKTWMPATSAGMTPEKLAPLALYHSGGVPLRAITSPAR